MSAALNIVVIDDNSTNRLLPGLFLRPLGHAVNECVGAEEALEWLTHNPCDVILLDISMPSVSGLQLCKQLRADQRYQHLGEPRHFGAACRHALITPVIAPTSSLRDRRSKQSV